MDQDIHIAALEAERNSLKARIQELLHHESECGENFRLKRERDEAVAHAAHHRRGLAFAKGVLYLLSVDERIPQNLRGALGAYSLELELNFMWPRAGEAMLEYISMLEKSFGPDSDYLKKYGELMTYTRKVFEHVVGCKSPARDCCQAMGNIGLGRLKDISK